MNFYQDLGYLILGTRLKRLSDTFLNDVNKFYLQLGVEFDASWFPIFYLLGRKNKLTIKEIADTLQVSHSAVSQLVTSLQQKGYLKVQTSATDARAKQVTLSAKGTQRLLQIQPVWLTLQQTMTDLVENNELVEKLLPALLNIESALAEKSLLNRLEQQYQVFESK
ncbi:MarR family winged helix-turn-helix transcriptional regulator [Gynurincola endophyticus]|uniref:MarR family winged helix-turn-helix transcriptional regulator n=1 Tax=Gynurincola endophyticus TaxID=2479004 RepID=UPI000F8C312C|nr:helix-turn-helix domain-containing protein [Gynurincola endophyticus]